MDDSDLEEYLEMEAIKLEASLASKRPHGLRKAPPKRAGDEPDDDEVEQHLEIEDSRKGWASEGQLELLRFWPRK